MEIDPTQSTKLSPLNAIRVETALSRYPVHRLAKRGDFTIDIKEQDRGGSVLIRWEVSHNSKYGQPGPLAYKLDTLIINRRIEEATRPIPRIIKLGSLHEICRELGVTEGKNVMTVKKALYQNAGAFITAHTCYRQGDGTEKTLEAGFTRYSVVFSGEKLPDGRKADAVYLVLNDIYMQVINGAMTRPLDYDYLKSLPPAPQRFYELLSYQMYAALKHDRPRAKLTYSYFCNHAPQTRYFDWEKARKQLAKVHAPHKKSGYIAKVEFEQTIDGDGQPDWLMLYTPGPRARAEYRAFTKRGGPGVIEVEPMPLEPLVSTPKQRQLQLDLEPPPLAMELIQRDVTKSKAMELLERFPAEVIAAKIDVLDWLTEKHDKRVDKSPAGYLVKSITDDYATPKGFVSRTERQRREEAKQAKEQQAAAARRRKQEEEAEDRRRRKLTSDYWNGLTKEQQAEHDATAIAQADDEDKKLIESGPMKRFGLTIIREKHILRLLHDQGKMSAVEG